MKSESRTAQNTREKPNPRVGQRKTLVKNYFPSWDDAKHSLFCVGIYPLGGAAN